VDEKEILTVLKHHPRAILEANLPAQGKQRVLIHQIQKNNATGRISHIDFHQINMNEPIETTVGIRYTGEAPGVKEGGLLQTEIHEITVRCMPNQLPEAIELDISELGIGDKKLVSDLEVGDGVEILSDPGSVLVTILPAQKTAETEEPAEAETTEKNEE